MLLNSLSELSIWLCLSDRTVLFSLLTCFLFATTRWDCHEILGLLSFRANVESFPTLTDLQVRSSSVACQNSKAFNYKFVAK